jgi:hypothetical protein
VGNGRLIHKEKFRDNYAIRRVFRVVKSRPLRCGSGMHTEFLETFILKTARKIDLVVRMCTSFIGRRIRSIGELRDDSVGPSRSFIITRSSGNN